MPSPDTNNPITPLCWAPDILPGFEQITLQCAPAADGPVDIVLVRRRVNAERSQGAAVLYLHGFIDYFFQSHLADFYLAQGLDFYALDLRRHGRSLRPWQRPNFTASIDEYLTDVAQAVRLLQAQEGVTWLLLNGHSTGGLVAALYAHRGEGRAAVKALFLNSPFLDMNLPPWQARFAEPLVAALGRPFPYLRLPGLSPAYAQSIHADHHGEWRFDTRWKPIEGFPIYAGWFRAIHRAQAEVADGLNIEVPCLLLHAEQSRWPKHWCEDAMGADTVLNVADMRRLGPGLGKQVEIHAIEGGMHDLVLSRPAVREGVWARLGDWLQRCRPS